MAGNFTFGLVIVSEVSENLVLLAQTFFFSLLYILLSWDEYGHILCVKHLVA